MFLKRTTNLKTINYLVKNTILTPHNAALTLECRKRMSVEACKMYCNFLQNKIDLNKNNIINLMNLNF